MMMMSLVNEGDRKRKKVNEKKKRNEEMKIRDVHLNKKRGRRGKEGKRRGISITNDTKEDLEGN